MKRNKGLTIVQLMLVLFVAGMIGWFVVEYIIDKRCEGDATSSLCVQRQAKSSP